MILTDTHTHLYSEKFDNDREAMVKRAIDARVRRLFLPNIDVHSIQPMLDLVWKFPEHCFPMMGLHPCSVDGDFESQLFQIQKWFKKRKFYAVGEIGLDYYWSVEFKAQQLIAFKKQIQWAIQLNLPINIHSRNSTDEVIEVLQEMKHANLRGIFHCFSGNAQQAQQITQLGFYLGIGGVVTYKKSELPEAIANIPLDYLVLETDAPYLSPEPYRGKRNESAYLFNIAEKMAQLKNTTIEQVALITTANSENIYGV